MEICEYHTLSVSPECCPFIVYAFFCKYRAPTLNLVTVQKEVFPKGFPARLRNFCKTSKQSIPLSKSGNTLLHKNFSWNAICFASFNIYFTENKCFVHEGPSPLEPIQRTVVPQSHMVPGQLICGFGAQGQPIPQLQHCSTATPGIRTHVQQVTGSRLRQYQYSPYSFKIDKSLKNNLILRTKKKATFKACLL